MHALKLPWLPYDAKNRMVSQVWVPNPYGPARILPKTVGTRPDRPGYVLWLGSTWWRHQMEIFSISLALCAGNSLVPSQSPVNRSFDVFFAWWRHQTFFALMPFVRGIHRSPMNSPHQGQWRGALKFSLICVWTNGWAHNRDAGDMRHHRTHYYVTVIHYQYDMYVQLVLTVQYALRKFACNYRPHSMTFMSSCYISCGRRILFL